MMESKDAVDGAGKTGIYGLMAEFDDPTDVVRAAQRVYDEGYRKIDAYSPYPIEELSEAIGFHTNRVPLVVLIGGFLGCAGGAALRSEEHTSELQSLAYL